MKYIILKKYYLLLSFIFLTQVIAFANTSDSIQTDQDSSLGFLVQNQRAVIQEYNAEVQNLLISIPQTKNDIERNVEAQKLTQLMEGAAQRKILAALHTLEKIAEMEINPVNIRVSAIKALSEHTFPNYNINDIIFEEADPPLEILRSMVSGANILKKNYTQTKRRFSKLYHFIHLDPSVQEAWASMWININIHNSDIHEKLLYLLSSNNTTTQQIALLISEKLKNEHKVRPSPTIRRIINGIKSNDNRAQVPTENPTPPAVATRCPQTFSTL